MPSKSNSFVAKTARVRGKLIVFEGSDGTGKTTQSKLLISYLRKQQIPNAYISFPRYKSSLWGAMVRDYLDGKFGKVNEVDAKLASILYAGDRFSAKEQIEKWLDDGKTVVCNRYTGSNIAHMGAKIKNKNKRNEFVRWLTDLEYKENKIPGEDVVVLLHIPAPISQDLMRDRVRDIHEEAIDYLKSVVSFYEELGEKRKNWFRIECVENKKLLAPGEIAEKIIEQLKKKGIF